MAAQSFGIARGAAESRALDPRLPRLPASAPLEALFDAIDRSGVVVLEGAIAPDMLAAINAELEPLMAQCPLGRPDAQTLFALSEFEAEVASFTPPAPTPPRTGPGAA